MTKYDEARAALIELLDLTQEMTTHAAGYVAGILRDGMDRPLGQEEFGQLLDRIVTAVRDGAERRGDGDTVAALDLHGAALVQKAQRIREDFGLAKLESSVEAASEAASDRLMLRTYDGIAPQAVRPTPMFHERAVAVVEGFVSTREIGLWDGNDRLDIHLAQFRQKYGRGPDRDEVLSIMQSKMSLPGIEGSDQFAIQALARSIAVNGVRKSPIIDLDGTLLDGNRRVTACYYILNSPEGEFTAEERRRAEWIKVWQLTDHATHQDREAVVVSLNFEPDFKQDWPEYVKAKKVYAEYERLVTLEPRANPSSARLTEIRSIIARMFALSKDEVRRYVDMVKIAEEFEDYHVEEKGEDPYKTKHRASERFQYFDELNKGKGAGGVNWALNQSDAFKHTVYDLLFDGKFRNWQQIRALKFVYNNEEAEAVLRKARDEVDRDVAEDLVEDAIGVARTERMEDRQKGANHKVRVFTDWFLGLPVKAFDTSDPAAITPENLLKLASALRIVEDRLPALSQDGTSDAA